MFWCGSTTLSRFHRQACVHEEAAKPEVLLQGSLASSPNTGTVQVEADSDREPKKYCTPPTVVIFQCSPLSSPLPAPVSRSIREPSSLSRRQSPSASFLT